MMKRLLHSFLALMVLTVPLTGCHSSAQTVSGSAKASPTGAGKAKAGNANGAEDPTNIAPLKLPLVDPRIEVRKAERKLLLFSNGRLVRTYHVGLGVSPMGDKVRAGDRRTPEGDFYIFTKNAKSAFYLSLGVSYPNLAHAKRGLRDGLINQAQYDQIAAANKQKKTPPQRTKLGGDIFIHGHGASSDWTWGCVALENEDIRELYEAVEVGTPVKINP
jgi:L,D-peptidoglycan transpeptidase YkuD (ErfK/YbiS/YcfS/YnhG family)